MTDFGALREERLALEVREGLPGKLWMGGGEGTSAKSGDSADGWCGVFTGVVSRETAAGGAAGGGTGEEVTTFGCDAGVSDLRAAIEGDSAGGGWGWD
jgi:hypothetical protein